MHHPYRLGFIHFSCFFTGERQSHRSEAQYRYLPVQLAKPSILRLHFPLLSLVCLRNGNTGRVWLYQAAQPETAICFVDAGNGMVVAAMVLQVVHYISVVV